MKQTVVVRNSKSDQRGYTGRLAGLLTGGFIWFIGWGVPVFAEAPDEQALRLGADGNAARHNSAGVYLNDSLEASDAIVKAATLVASRRWKEAATLLQDTLVSAGDKLVRVAPGHYVGVREHITHILCGWPEEGQDAYRDLFERELIAELDKTLPDRSIGERFPEAAGTSTRRLLSLFDRYFCTSAAAELADTIGQLSIEAGDLALARHVYQRVVDGHPDRSTYTPKYQTMLALLGAMRGDAETSVPAAGDEVKLRWRGADRPLDDVLEEARRSFSALSRGTDPGDWPIFGGNTERSRRSESTIDELGLLWLTDLFKKPPEGAGDLGRGYHEDVGVGLSLSVQPVVHDELVFVQRQRELAAIHRNTGVVAWRFRADRVQGDVYEELDSRPPGWDSPTVHDGRVYVSLPGDVVPYYGYESPQSPPELVCLDASTGEVLWRSEREGLSERPSELGFDSSPIVDHGRLYVIGRRRRSFGFEDCYLYCLNAVDGRMLFRTHVGSASTGTFGARRPTPAVASLHEDMVYLCSNLGTITALSAYTGAVRWLRQYDRDVDAGSRGSGGREPPPWTFNPVFVSGDRLVAMPMDSSNVLVLAKDDGRNLDIIPVEEFAGIEMLFGMEGDVLCGVGAEVACYDVGDGALSWSAKLEAQERPLGRGVWAGEHLYVPAGTGVSMFEVSDGQRTDIAWSQGGRSGNLVALPGELFVAGADSLAVYVRKTELWNALRARMAASPSAPLPALELAEVALRGGEYAEATEVLDEAVRRADAFARAMEPSLRKRFFDDALMFAEVMNARSVLTPSVLDKLFTLAMQCAPDARGHVDYRFRFAKLYDQFHKPDRALPLYQQVLRDRSLRKIKIECPGAPPEIAEEAARVGIAELIARHGAAIYAPFEAEAKRWYARGLASANVELLARVADTFPNSDTAPLALIAQGELLAQMNRPDESARLLARAYHRYPEQVNRAQLIRKIADAYEQAGRPEHAYRWLTKAAREHPGARTEYRGRWVSFLEYRERLASARAKVDPSRPKLVLPLGERYVREFDEAVSLLTPRFGEHPYSRWDRYFVASERAIRAFDVRTDSELWGEAVPVQNGAELLIATDQEVVFATPYAVFAVDADTGVRLWLHGNGTPDRPPHFMDWEVAGRYRSHALRGRRLVSVRDDGEMSCVDIVTGDLLWSETRRPTPAEPVRIGDVWVIYQVVQDDETVIGRVDAATGAWIDATLTHETHPPVDLFLALDGLAVLVTARTVSAYDLESGDRRWQIRLSARPRPGSLLLDIDSLYLSDDGRRVHKIALEDGRDLWQSERLSRRGEEDITVQLQDGALIVSTSSSITAVDEVTGLTLWRGTTPEQARFSRRLLSRAYVVAVEVKDEAGGPECMAYFYDHRNASGVIPRVGGTLALGKVPAPRTIIAGDGALLIQSGTRVLGWRNE